MVEKNPPYQIQWTSQYKKDIKRAKKRNYDMEEHRELHIRPDWLLIYQKKENLLILELTRTGTHADLFDL